MAGFQVTITGRFWVTRDSVQSAILQAIWPSRSAGNVFVSWLRKVQFPAAKTAVWNVHERRRLAPGFFRPVVVAGRCRDIGVPHKPTHRVQVGAALEELGTERAPEVVRSSFGEARLLCLPRDER